MSRFCDYSDTPPNPTVEDLAALRGRLAELESKLQDATTRCSSAATSISPPAEDFLHDQSAPVFPQLETWAHGLPDFDPTMFLDARLFRDGGLPVTGPIVNIPHVSASEYQLRLWTSVDLAPLLFTVLFSGLEARFPAGEFQVTNT
jgi:hypothetical protein